jgi:carbonic anhydrase/acetyltransferase-like protein (isoleucine patch superfamily)
MKLLKSISKRTFYSIGRMVRESGLALDQYGSRLERDIAYLEPLSRHRQIMPLYDLEPKVYHTAFIAPNATIIGEVHVGHKCSIWYGAVLRGDINAIRIGQFTSIGDNTVIHTAGSLPTGIPASVNIGNFVNIQSGSTLYSCTIDDEVLVGFKSIILEGAKLERGCIIGPNSVVPPGRLIPAGQVWAGNPVEYVRDAKKDELAFVIDQSKRNLSIAELHQYEFLPQNSAYLQKSNTADDLKPEKLVAQQNLPHEDGLKDNAHQKI